MNMTMKAMIMILIQVKRKQTITQQTPIIIKIMLIKMTETTMTGDQLISIIISIITRFVFNICLLVNFEKCNCVA